MTRIEYDKYMSQLRPKALRMYTRWSAQEKDIKHSSKSRAPEEDIALFILDRQRWQRALANGSIEKVGPRRYRWHG